MQHSKMSFIILFFLSALTFAQEKKVLDDTLEELPIAEESSESLWEGSYSQNKKLLFLLHTVYQSTTLETEASTSTNASSSSLTVIGIKPELTYFLSPKWAINIGYLNSLMVDLAASVQGAEVGGKYYFLGSGNKYDAQLGNLVFQSSPNWAPFINLSYTFTDWKVGGLSIHFSGLKAGAGLDWHKFERLIFSAQLTYETLTGSNRSSTSIGTSIGLGVTF